MDFIDDFHMICETFSDGFQSLVLSEASHFAPFERSSPHGLVGMGSLLRMNKPETKDWAMMKCLGIG